MIDIHTHILPGFDDGPRTMEEALLMAAIAAADGVRQLVATPHDPFWKASVLRQRVDSAVSDLREAIRAQGSDVDILPGLELYVTTDLGTRMNNGQFIGINNGRYVLVEFPLQSYPTYADQSLFDLQLQGFLPILAHPERNVAIQRDVSTVESLVLRGIMVQITADSILGSFGPRTQATAELMLTRNMAHIIASDAHSSGARPPVLSRAVHRASELVGLDRAEAMVSTIPEAVISGEPVELLPPVQYKPRKSWFGWRRTE